MWKTKSGIFDECVLSIYNKKRIWFTWECYLWYKNAQLQIEFFSSRVLSTFFLQGKNKEKAYLYEFILYSCLTLLTLWRSLGTKKLVLVHHKKKWRKVFYMMCAVKKEIYSIETCLKKKSQRDRKKNAKAMVLAAPFSCPAIITRSIFDCASPSVQLRYSNHSFSSISSISLVPKLKIFFWWLRRVRSNNMKLCWVKK